jgi:hypothetical protein
MNAINLKFIVTRTINEPFVDIWALCNGRNNKKEKSHPYNKLVQGHTPKMATFPFSFLNPGVLLCIGEVTWFQQKT